MKSQVLLHTAAVAALAFILNACGKQEAPVAAAPKPEESKPADQPAAVVEAPAPAKEPEMVAPVDLNGFGSDEPAPRAGEPTRGVIVIDLKDIKRMAAAHWEQFDCTNFNAKRWGRYQVRLTYTLKHATLGTQFRFGQQPMKKTLMASAQPKRVVYGDIYIEKAGVQPFVLLIASNGAESGFTIHELAFVPAPEGPTPTQAEDGSIVLEAKSATTWSENMRYEPKPEKNCLGFWTSEDDFAEWDFDVEKPGRYKVTVVHGCGGGNEGSEVAVKFDGQELKFVTDDTGGFQNWKELPVGEVEIKKSGLQRLVIDPVTKVKSAILDVRKVLLTPAG